MFWFSVFFLSTSILLIYVQRIPGIRACCHRASDTYYRTASRATTQHSPINPHMLTELARASMSSSIYTARCVLKTNEEIEICPAYEDVCPFTNQLTWCDTRRVCLCTALPLRPFYFVHACGVRAVLVGHGALGICASTMYLSVRFIHSLHSFACYSFLCERAY